MKKFSYTLMIAIFAMSFAIVSCDKDDDTQKDSKFTYEEADYSLSSGSLEFYGPYEIDSSSVSYNFDVTLYSSEISFESDSTGYVGIGDFIYFEMFSSSATELVEGTYNFDGDASFNPNTFDFGIFGINYNIEIYVGDVDGFIVDGTVIIEKDGSTYKISIDCTDGNNKSITGYYEGTLDYSDSSDDKSVTAKKSYFKN